MISSNGRSWGSCPKTSAFNYSNSRCPTNTAHMATRMGNGKGSAPVFSSIPMHMQRMCSETESQLRYASCFVDGILSILPGENRTDVTAFIYGMFSVPSFAVFISSFLTLPLLAGNGPNLNQMPWVFFFLFFQRRGCFTGQKPQMHKWKMQDRWTIFCNNQGHSSQLFRNLLWLH